MPKGKLYYTIRNCGDGSAAVGFYADEKSAQLACDIEDEGGEAFCENDPHLAEFEFDSKGRLLNPDATKEQLERELAEKRGEHVDEEDDSASPAAAFTKAAGKAAGPFKATVYYTIENCGDGSATARFFADRECAQLACDIEEEGGEAFCEMGPHVAEFKFSAKGVLLNPDSTADELKKELAALRKGEDEDDELSEAFEAVATPAAANAAVPLDLQGKNVVFTGKLSTMTRDQAEAAAMKQGASVSQNVTANTDILIVGDRPGSKLAKAKKLGVTVVTEAEWAKTVQTPPAAGKPPTPSI